MKSFIALFVICATLAARSSAMTKEELFTKAMEMAKACQGKEGASTTDIEEFFTHQVPTTETGKCFRACIMETLEVLIDNAPNVENAVKLADQMSNGNPEAIQLIKDLHEECNPTAIGANRCETAYNIVKCTVGSMDRRGIDHSKFYEA